MYWVIIFLIMIACFFSGIVLGVFFGQGWRDR